MPQDNRNFYRLPVSVPAARAHKALHDGSLQELRDPLILDLSIGGLKLHVRESIAANDPLTLTFSFAGETFEVKGLAVWVSDSEYSNSRHVVGLRFESIETKTRERLARLIHREQIRNLKMGVR
jgi:c-di-GMP-binding flagellar brake protein YcgR